LQQNQENSMRLALLASAAICLSAGVAMAQATTSSPAPTGAPNAAMSSPNGSPGNMAPSAKATPVYSGQDSIKTTTTSNPAPTGAPGAAQITQPGASPGNMAPNNGGMSASTSAGDSSGMTKMSSNSHMRGAWHMMAMPTDGDARTYLHIASDAIKQHNKMRADDALSRAETRMLDRAVPASSGPVADDSPVVTSIERARQALASGDYSTAASDTKMAMHAHHGMIDNDVMSPMSGSGAMGGPTQ
jgi:hypothetical protein